MQGLTIKRPIKLKAKVTETLKKGMIAEIEETIKNLELEIRQIDFQGKHLLSEAGKHNIQQMSAIRQQIEIEKQKRNEMKSKLNAQLGEVKKLNLGDEVLQGTLEGLAEIHVGDDLEKILNTEIVVEDGKIIEIREP